MSQYASDFQKYMQGRDRHNVQLAGAGQIET